MPRDGRWHRRRRNCRRFSRIPGGSSMIRRRSGRPRSRSAAARSPRPNWTLGLLAASASPTSAKPRWSGIVRPGKPVYNAIVWQDRRTAESCAELKEAGHEKAVIDKTGLLLDPYFSGTKIAWILNNVAGARRRPRRARWLPAPIECFLLWRLTGGKVHASDATNASRTPAVRYSQGHLGSGAVQLLACRRPCCRTWSTARATLASRLPIFGGAGPGARHGGRPAGCDRWPGLHQARHGEGDLRHRLLRDPEYRQHRDAFDAIAC